MNRLHYIILHHIFLIILGVVAAFTINILATAIGVVVSSEHYIGMAVIEDTEQEKTITEMIDRNNITIGLDWIGVWSNPYTVTVSDNGHRILKYGFFSKNRDLPLQKAK